MTKHHDVAVRFDDSFLSHMVRDFFFVLLVVVIAELGFRFCIVWYDFHNESKLQTEDATRQLAEDVKSIMLNSGGPVAARTIYPILKKNFDDIGYAIAIQPSELTVNAINSVFNFNPRGIPPNWPEGLHNEFRVKLRAEQFCISCHIGATPGDVLGEIVVRNYLSSHLSQWWEEVKLTSLLGMGKIVLHTIVLFFLLRVRMEPLLSLRSTITQLARGASDLSHRAAINSRDEFGELARDLNLFLDRIDHVAEDLGAILTRVIALNQRLNQVQSQILGEFQRAESVLQTTTKQLFDSRDMTVEQSSQWLNAMNLSLASLQALAVEKGLANSLQNKLERCVQDIQILIDTTQSRPDDDTTGKQLVELSTYFQSFSHYMGEMATLEEKMFEIAEQGQTLLDRLSGVKSARDKNALRQC